METCQQIMVWFDSIVYSNQLGFRVFGTACSTQKFNLCSCNKPLTPDLTTHNWTLNEKNKKQNLANSVLEPCLKLLVTGFGNRNLINANPTLTACKTYKLQWY